MKAGDIALYIWRIFPPCLMILGTLGNVTSVCVLMKRKNGKSSIAKYLTVMAVSDMIVLWTALPRNWLFNGVGVDIRNYSDFVCKVQVYFLYFGSHSSTCMVVIVTIERFVSTWLPFKQRTICTSRNANIIIICAIACLALLNGHFIYGVGRGQGLVCLPINDSYAKFLFDYWPKITLVMFTLMPLAILFPVNLAIIIQLLVVRRRARRAIVPRSVNQKENMTKNQYITVMLVVLGIVYMICVTPALVFLLLYSDWIPSRGTVPTNDVLEIVWSMVNLLYYTNFSVNFLLYFLSGTTFRAEAKKLVKSMAVCRSESTP